MPWLVDTPSPLVFWLVPVLVSIPFAVWKDTFGGWLPASAVAAICATVLYLAFLISKVGYSPTGASLAAAFTFVQYVLVCAVTVGLLTLFRKAILQKR